MKILHEIYGLGVSDTRYRSKLKHTPKDYFKASISFLPSTSEVIVNTDCATGTFFVDEDSHIRAPA